ncbi:MAG: hypothetical protein AABX02_03650, partial [archaeon]
MNARSRGFVLSFAVLTIAMFIFIFARLEADHLFLSRYSQSHAWSALSPARIAADAGMDLNALIDQRFRMDQNQTDVILSFGGTLPGPVGNRTNWLRYQTALHNWGHDANVDLVLDLNQTFADGNVVGRTNTGFVWEQNLDANRIIFYTTNSFSQPNEIDINITSESAYTSKNAWALLGGGDVLVKWRYTDQNTNHTDSNTGWVSFSNVNRYDWIYGNGAYRFTLTIAQTPDGNSLVLD